MPGRYFLTATIDELAGHFAAEAAGIEESAPRMDAAYAAELPDLPPLAKSA